MNQPIANYKNHRFPPEIIARAVWLPEKPPVSTRGRFGDGLAPAGRPLSEKRCPAGQINGMTFITIIANAANTMNMVAIHPKSWSV